MRLHAVYLLLVAVAADADAQSAPVRPGGQDACTNQSCEVASLTSSGAVNAASVTASGNVGGATVSSTGALSAGSASVTNALSAGSVTSSGAVSAASVTATGAVSGSSLTATNGVSAASATISGAVSGNTVSATGALSGGSISVTGASSASTYSASNTNGCAVTLQATGKVCRGDGLTSNIATATDGTWTFLGKLKTESGIEINGGQITDTPANAVRINSLGGLGVLPQATIPLCTAATYTQSSNRVGAGAIFVQNHSAGVYNKVCMCRTDGTGPKWFNLLNPGDPNGTTTTCPDNPTVSGFTIPVISTLPTCAAERRGRTLVYAVAAATDRTCRCALLADGTSYAWVNGAGTEGTTTTCP